MWTSSRRLLSEQQGFTLVEMMIALLVFGIGLVGLAQVFPRGVHVRERSEQKGVAASLAQGEIERLHSLPFNDPALSAGDHTDPNNPLEGGHKRRWTVQDGVPIAGMKRVTVTVSFPTASPDSLVSLTTQVSQ